MTVLIEEGYTGEGVKVAIIDTGVNQDLRQSFTDDNFVYYNVVSEDSNVIDTHSHGSRVTCLMICESNDKRSGLIPDTDFVIIKAYDDYNRIEPEYISSAIEYAVGQEVDIINLSLGTKQDFGNIESAIKDAENNGVIVIAAYGNEEELYPAKYDSVYSAIGIESDVNADFMINDDVYNLVENVSFNYSENISSYAAAITTCYLALYIEKCDKENTDFNIKGLGGRWIEKSTDRIYDSMFGCDSKYFYEPSEGRRLRSKQGKDIWDVW